jgi:hypothetical protein
MKEVSDNVSKNSKTSGMFAIAAFLTLFASTFGVGWMSFGAVAGTSDIEWMGDIDPEPTGDPFSGWIPDQLIDMAGVEAWYPQIATGPGGDVHAVYQVQASIGGWQILHQQSSDGGLTWTAPSGVAATPDDEINPDIAIHPGDGRIFVAYERWISGTDSQVWISYSDDGSTWNRVMVADWVTYPDVDPSVVVDHDTGAGAYYVWVAYTYLFDPDNSNVMVHRSDDQGATWAQQHFLGMPPDDDVYDDPELAFQHGSDGVDRLLLVCRNGVDLATTNTVHLDWSEDFGVTWSSFVVATETNIVDYPTIAASRGRDSIMVAWQHNAADISIRYRGNTDPTTPGASWTGVGTRFPTGGNGVADRAPRLAVDGDGTMNNNMAGNYHLIWTVGGLDRDVVYTMRPTDLTAGWTNVLQVSDTAAQASPGLPSKGITTQLRGSSWYPAVVWSDFRAAPPNDIGYTTPGSRVTVDTNPGLLNVEVDFLPYPAPAAFIWPAGWSHNLNVQSPQPGGPGIQYVWSDWSDLGPQSHFVVADTIDRTYTANFITQYEITIDAWDQTNLAPLPNVPVYIDGPQVGTTQHVAWLDDGVAYNIGVQDPYNDGFNDFNFVDWDYGPNANPVVYTPNAPDSITANYDMVLPSTFSLEVNPPTITIPPGDTAQYTIRLTSLSGYAGDVDLSATALPGTLLPPGGTATATFLPNPATVPLGGQVTSTLTIDNTAAVPDDIYTITVLGQDTVSAVISDSNDTELIVATPTFDVTATPLTLTRAPGQNAVYDVTVTSISGYDGFVGLNATSGGLLPPAIATFVPSVVSVPDGGSAQSTLTISNTGTVPDATYLITIVGDDPLGTDSFNVDLVLTTVPFFMADAAPTTQQVAPGDQTSFIVTITSVNSYVGTVDVSVSSPIPGADATLSWSSTMVDVPADASNSTTLTVDTNPSIADGDYILTFYAEDLLLPLNDSDTTTLNVSSTLPGSIAGTIEDENGDPIENADVVLVDDNDQTVDSTTSDDVGAYKFTDVDPGSYTVKASKTGYRDDERSLTLSGSEDKTGQDLELKFGSIEGVVVDENDEGVPDATVEILDENGDVVGTDTTNSQGKFEIDDLLLGTYTVRISADGFETLTVDSVEITNADPSNDMGNTEVTKEDTGNFLADYWWLLLIIIIIVVVLILVLMLAKRKKPAPEEAPPEYATAQVPAEQAPYQEAPAEQPPYQEPPPEQYPPQEPQPEPQPEPYPEESPPEPATPPEGYPPEE